MERIFFQSDTLFGLCRRNLKWEKRVGRAGFYQIRLIRASSRILSDPLLSAITPTMTRR